MDCCFDLLQLLLESSSLIFSTVARLFLACYSSVFRGWGVSQRFRIYLASGDWDKFLKLVLRSFIRSINVCLLVECVQTRKVVVFIAMRSEFFRRVLTLFVPWNI